jgi:hypothetical protein
MWLGRGPAQWIQQGTSFRGSMSSWLMDQDTHTPTDILSGHLILPHSSYLKNKESHLKRMDNMNLKDMEFCWLNQQDMSALVLGYQCRLLEL